jgi:hypothetical protein
VDCRVTGRASERHRSHDGVGVDPQFNPKPDAFESHPIAVGCPLDPPTHSPELRRDVVNRYFETASGLVLGLAVLDGQAINEIY